MSALRTSLQRLMGAIGELENTVDVLEVSRAGLQRDMFAVEVAPPENAAPKNKKAIAERLDVAIEKVEKLLAQSA